MSGKLKVTRRKVGKTICRIEADNAFVFISAPKMGEIYINIGGYVFWAKSESAIILSGAKP